MASCLSPFLAVGPVGRLVAAFFIGGAITTVVAFALASVAYGADRVGLGQHLFAGIRVISSIPIGAAMALAFLIAKAKGPAAPIAAAFGALVAERVGVLLCSPLWGWGDGWWDYGPAAITGDALDFSDGGQALFMLVNWVAVLIVPITAGVLTALLSRRKPKAPPTVPAWAPAPVPWVNPNPAFPPAPGPRQPRQPPAGPSVPN